MVKTAISMPDETYEAVTARARELGISRSRYLVLAAERMLREDRRAELVRRIDAAVASVGHVETDPDWREYGRRRLAAIEDDW